MLKNDFPNLKIEGIIRNTGHTPIDYIFIKCIGYNRKGEIIGSGNAIPVINFSLESNQTVHFQTEILNDTQQGITSYSINCDSHSTREVSPTPFVAAATPEPKARPASSIYYTDFPRNASPRPVSTLVPTPTPGPVTVTLIPMTKEQSDNLAQEKIRGEQAKRKLFEKQEAEREANGDFSQAPWLTPEQREAAEVRWAEKDAAERLKGAKPAPQ